MHLASPGVERAVAAATERAVRLGLTAPRLVDLVLGLLDEEEGRPAELIERMGLAVSIVRKKLSDLSDSISVSAPPLAALYEAARNWSIANRADPSFMTDAFLVATLKFDATFAASAALAGLDVERITSLMTNPSDSPFASTDDKLPTFALPDASDDVDAGRIVDANLNRSREALRVLEDYCRFVLDDRFLSARIKELRHELATVAHRFPPGLLLAARDALHDVGTTISAAGEYHRGSPSRVAEVNSKRLQESLRSLEEYGKLFGPELGRVIESLRYQSYTLERAISRGDSSRSRLGDAKLYVLLTPELRQASTDWIVANAVAGGATIFQLREKDAPDRDFLNRARELRQWTRSANVLFIVNDRADIAKLAEADGVHLGQGDLTVKDARRILGPNSLIGVSTHSIEQVRRAVLDGADYIGVGPTFPSKTKAFDVFPGLEFVAAVAAETSLPAYAIGGIGPENIDALIAAGGRRVAVGSSITEAEDPERVARLLRSVLDG